jgi:DNA-binding transcriptional regulator YiaG
MMFKSVLFKDALTSNKDCSYYVGETILPTLDISTIAENSRPASDRQYAFARNMVASVGRCIKLRRTLCGLSKQQFGARLGINGADVDAYERGDKRISAKLLLAAAKHLRVRPTFFFQGKDAPSGSSVDTPARVLEQLAD